MTWHAAWTSLDSAFIADAAVFGGLGVLLGQRMTLFVLADPLRTVARWYRELLRDIGRLHRTGRWT